MVVNDPGAERLAAAEALLAEAMGKGGDHVAIDIAALCASHPELSDELRRLHSAWQWLEETASPSGGSAHDTCPLLGQRSVPGAPPPCFGEDRYQRLDSVARGGMGTVLRVWDTRLRRELAMKLVGAHREGATPHPSQDLAVHRFLEEAHVMGRLDHPGVVPVHDLGLDAQGRLFFTMRLVEGFDLGTVFNLVRTRSAGWSLPRALEVLVKVCETVAYAHSKGVVHRDLKPANVMIGQHGQVYVVDWGLARILGRQGDRPAGMGDEMRDSAHGDAREGGAATHVAAALSAESGSPYATLQGVALGTPAYMPPEQARGDIDSVGTRADVYAVGAMLYHLLCHRAPFSDIVTGNADLLRVVRERAPTPIRVLAPRAPAELIAVCEKAMAPDMDARYADLLDVAGDLRAFLENRVVSVHSRGPLAQFRKWSHRNPRAAVVGLATSLALGVTLSIGFWLHMRGQGRIETLDDQLSAARAEVRNHSDREADLGARIEIEAYAARLVSAQAAIESRRPGVARAILDSCLPARRGFEWRHLRSRLDTSVRMWGDPDHRETRMATLSPDGRRAFWTTAAGPVQVAETETGRITQTLGGLRERGTAIAIVADGTWLAAGDVSGSIHVWDANTGASRTTWTAHGRGHLWDIDIDSTGTLLASASCDGAARIWSMPDGRLMHDLRASCGQVFSAQFDASGDRLLTASEDGVLRVWDLAKQEVVASRRTRDCVTNQFWRARFLAGGRWIGHSTARGAIEILDASTLTPVATLNGQDGFAHEVLDCGHDVLATSSSDGTVRLWSMVDWRCLEVLPAHENALTSLEVDAGGNQMISGSADGTVKLWDLHATTSGNVRSFPFPVEAIAVHGDRMLAFGGGLSELQDLTTGARIWERRVPAPTGRVRWNAGGTLVAMTGSHGEVMILDASSGESVASLPFHGDGGCVAFHPDGKRLATGGLDGQVHICSAADGRTQTTLSNGAGVFVVEFDRAGQLLAIGDERGRIRLWDFERQQIVHDFQAHTGWTYELDFNRKGDQLVSASWDGTAAIWDTHTWERLAELRGHTNYVLSAAFSQDGSRVATTGSDTTVRIWDARSGTPLLCLIGHGAWVNEAVFAPDDSWLASCSSEGKVRFWRAR